MRCTRQSRVNHTSDVQAMVARLEWLRDHLPEDDDIDYRSMWLEDMGYVETSELMIEARAILDALQARGMDAREWVTAEALALWLCPVHFRDYAICFDDDDIECAQVRAVHPVHDT
jgi:hypothetical protein